MSNTRSIEEIADIQKNTLRVLVASQIAGSAALAAAVTVGAFVMQDILGQSTPWGGAASATVTMGTAFMAQVLARQMNQHGRRRGLQIGYALAIVGGLIAGVGAETKTLWFSSLVCFCLAMVRRPICFHGTQPLIWRNPITGEQQ